MSVYDQLFLLIICGAALVALFNFLEWCYMRDHPEQFWPGHYDAQGKYVFDEPDETNYIPRVHP